MRKAAIALFSVLAVMAATLLIVRSVQNRYMLIVAYTGDAGGLEEGTSVRLNGIPVGYLDKLNLTASRDPARKIEFVMKVQRHFVGDIPQDSLVNVAATNLLGNYFLDIIRGRSPQPVADGGELRTAAAADADKLMAQMGNEMQEISSIFDRFGNLVAGVPKGQGSVGKWETEGLNRLQQVSATYAEVQQSVRNAQGNLSHADDLRVQVDATQKRFNDLMAGIQNGQGSAGQVAKLSGDFHDLSAESDKLTAALNSKDGPGARIRGLQGQFDELAQKVQTAADRLNSGGGTLGQLTVNPQLSRALAQTEADFQAVAKGLQQNPKKFISIKLF